MSSEGVCAVVVTYNNEGTLNTLLDGLCAQDDAVAHLSVVDNGSTDHTVDILRDRAGTLPFSTTVRTGGNVGFAAGIERALQASDSGDRPILVVNPDVLLSPGVVPKMARLLDSSPDAAIVTAPLQLPDGSPDPSSRRRLPTLGRAGLYSVLGRRTPVGLRYNCVEGACQAWHEPTGLPYTSVEATTGALMLVSPKFRNAATGIFDTAYWMYGEDLQLCEEARRSGRTVLMLEVPGSVHFKGSSSGLPRGVRSDRAFHRALFLYYSKNLRHNGFESAVVGGAIASRYLVSRAHARLARGWRADDG